jgi:hypothetical protein
MLARLAEQSVAAEVPAGIVAATQQYSTLHGNAVALQFAFDSARYAFQRLPLTHPTPLAVYNHAAYKHLFAKLAEPRFAPGKQSHGAPAANVLQQLGTINTSYLTVHRPGHAAHPASANVELVRTSHRQGLNVSISLWDADQLPLSTLLLTGAGDDDVGKGVLVTADGERDKALRLERPERSLPGQGSRVWSSRGGDGADGDVGDTKRGKKTTQRKGKRSKAAGESDALYALGDVEAMSNGGFRMFSGAAWRPAPADDGEPPTLPPWAVDSAVHEFATAVARAVDFPAGGGGGGGAARPALQLIAVNARVADVASTDFFELVCAAPRLTADYHGRPWEQRTGAPALRGGPLMALRVEARQGGIVRGVGTYFYAPVPRAA